MSILNDLENLENLTSTNYFMQLSSVFLEDRHKSESVRKDSLFNPQSDFFQRKEFLSEEETFLI